jgi:hypothetical protein
MIYGIYDLEIAKAIPPKVDADRLPGIEYCGGWTDYANMGVACWALCFLDTEDWSISEPIGGTSINRFGEPGERFLAHELISCGLSSIPIEWQRGNKEVVIDYCKNDVRIEAMTLQRLLQGTLMDPNTGNSLLYPMPGIAAII